MLRTIFNYLLVVCFSITSLNISYSQEVNSVPTIPDTRENIQIDYLKIYYEALELGSGNSFPINLSIHKEEIEFIATPNGVYEMDNKMDIPDILTYDLFNKEKNISGVLTLSSAGLYATFISKGELIVIYPQIPEKSKTHIIEYGIQPDLPKMDMMCGHDHSVDEMIRRPSPFNKNGLRSKLTMGQRRYTFNVAVVATGEYYRANGNTDNAVRSAITQSINSMNLIFNGMMSFRMVTRSALIYVGYNDPNTDVFTPGQDRVAMARAAVNDHFPNVGSYDIGHVFHNHQSGDGWSTGGVAILRSVCNGNNFGGGPVKAGGWSGSFNNSGAGWLGLLAHELGHQFGATHTFNADGDNCEPNISSNTSYEIGSGTTIMSYNGLCAAGTNIPASGDADNYFHIINMEQMHNYIINTVGNSCGGPTNSTNAPPTVDANPCNVPNHRIPRNTPFFIDALGEWTDEDSHTYSWEQIDEDGPGTPTIGKVGSAAASDARAPLFRSYPPTPESFRYFPRLSDLRSGSINPFDVLPTVAREINLNVALRDNVSLTTMGGNVANDEVKITVENTGPLVVTAPAAAAVFQAGAQATFSWNTNGSESLCTNVRIKLSSDGGFTYPYVLGENISYASRTATLTIPQNFIASTEVRAMIECMDFDCFKFFNISPANFTINSNCRPSSTTLCSVVPVEADMGDDALNINVTKVLGRSSVIFNRNVTTASISGDVGINGADGVGCARETVRLETMRIYVTATGDYSFNSNNNRHWVSIQTSAYNPSSNPCGNRFIASNTTRTGASSVTLTSALNARLQECTEYVLVFFAFGQNLPANINLQYLAGPGDVIIIDENPSPNYVSSFVLTDIANNILYVGDNTDFRAFPPGDYRLYSIVYESNLLIEEFIGTNLNDFIVSVCHAISSEFKPIKINSACSITSITIGDQTPCVAATNFFNQTLTLTYEMQPESGNLIVNGQTFPITGSPQTITLQNLDSDGLPVTVEAFFSEFTTCRRVETNLFNAPPNCCPITINLPEEVSDCAGSSIALDAGGDGTSYVWTLQENGAQVGQGRTLNPTISGTYNVIVTHSSGCTKSASVNVTIHPLPVINVVKNQEFCEGETYQISANISGALSIIWQRNGITIPNETNPTLSITQAGTYRVIVINEFDCGIQEDIIVTQVARPIVSLGSNQNKCLGEIVTLDALNPGSSFQWFKDLDLNPIADATTQNFVVNSSGSYRVVVTNSAGCTASSSVTINFFDSPEVEDFPPLIIGCQGTPVKITARVQRSTSLQWYKNGIPIGNSNQLEIEVNESALYTIEASNLAGCKTSKSVQVEIEPLPRIDLEAGQPRCLGSTVTLRGGAIDEVHQWTFNGNPVGTTANQIDITEPGTYAVTVTNQFGCSAEKSVEISFSPGPELSLNGDATICEDSVHIINVTTNANNATFRWLKDGSLMSGEFNSSLSVTEPGIYSVLLLGGSPPCEVEKSVTIQVNPKPAFNLGSNQTLCEDETPPTLNAGASNVSFVWTLNGNPLATSQTVTANQSGIYVVAVTNSFGCKRTGQVRIEILGKPTLDVEDSYDICVGDSLTIDTKSNASSFQWSKDNQPIPNATRGTLTIKEAGNYKIVATVGTDCVNEKEFSVTVRPLPTVELGADVTLCPGENKILDAGANDKFLWSTGETTRQINVEAGNPTTTSTQKYTITVESDFGCKSSDEVNITTRRKVVANIISDKPGICSGEPVNLTASGGDNYQWTDPLGNTLSAVNTASVTATPSENVIYTVVVSDSNCPENTDAKNIEIKIFPEAEVSAGKDTCAISGRNLQLNASGGVAYQWDNPSSIIGASNIPNPVINITSETQFTVTITDSNGCTYEASVDICLRADLFKPTNVITPNGDGQNDELFFNGLEDFPDNTLQVFNRWGNLMYEAKGYQSNNNPLFNGLKNGERLPPDTYYYILTFDGQTIKSALTILWD